MEKKEKRLPRTMLVLLLLMCLSVTFMPELIARLYAQNDTTAQARVATFQINVKNGQGKVSSMQSLKTTIIPGETGENIMLQVENKSEVAVNYDITVKSVLSATNIKGVTLTKPDGTSGEALAQDGDTWTYSVEDQPAGKTDDYSLNIYWKKSDDNLQYMGMVDYYTVTITARQTD
jgi:CxxC motif-containing protein